MICAKVQELAEKDPSPVSVARRLSASYSLSLSPGTVRHWMVGDRKPSVTGWVRNIFKELPSPELSYVIGANKGDGCTLPKSGVVKLEVTDKDFAQAFNANMAALFSRAKSNKIFVRRRADRLPMYIVKYSCRPLVRLLRGPLKKLFEIASAFPREFLRGFFDAEGFVEVAAKTFFDARVGAENCNRTLLSGARRMLQVVFHISSTLHLKRNPTSLKTIRGESFLTKRASYRLLIVRDDQIERFGSLVGFSIHRKMQKLEDVLNVLRTKKPKERTAAWKEIYLKRNGEWKRRWAT